MFVFCGNKVDEHRLAEARAEEDEHNHGLAEVRAQKEQQAGPKRRNWVEDTVCWSTHGDPNGDAWELPGVQQRRVAVRRFPMVVGEKHCRAELSWKQLRDCL